MHSLGPVNVCTNFEVNRYKIDEFRNMQKSYVLFHVTWHKNGNSYVIAAPRLVIGISTRNILKPTRNQPGLKVMAQTVVFMFLVTLTFNLQGF